MSTDCFFPKTIISPPRATIYLFLFLSLLLSQFLRLSLQGPFIHLSIPLRLNQFTVLFTGDFLWKIQRNICLRRSSLCCCFALPLVDKLTYCISTALMSSSEGSMASFCAWYILCFYSNLSPWLFKNLSFANCNMTWVDMNSDLVGFSHSTLKD